MKIKFICLIMVVLLVFMFLPALAIGSLGTIPAASVGEVTLSHPADVGQCEYFVMAAPAPTLDIICDVAPVVVPSITVTDVSTHTYCYTDVSLGSTMGSYIDCTLPGIGVRLSKFIC